MPLSGRTSPARSSILSAEDAFIFVPFAEDPLLRLAELLVARHRAQLPDLSRHVVLLPQAHAGARLRSLLLRVLAQHGHPALLPPFIGTLAQWLAASARPVPALSERQREAMLMVALAGHPHLHSQPVRWPFIDSLLRLFDDLNRAKTNAVADETELRSLLARGYGTERKTLAPLSQESRLVHGLWQAWREHLAAHGVEDESTRMPLALRSALAGFAHDRHIYAVGLVETTAAELDGLNALRARGQLTVILHGMTGQHPRAALAVVTAHPGAPDASSTERSACSEMLDEVFDRDSRPLSLRARGARARFPNSPLSPRLSVYEGADAEDEVRAVDVQVRQWWLQGLRDIAVVTHDRKLARRLRALLERAGLPLLDASGWPLSTTSAATVVVRWLEAVERNFPPSLLIDLLQSPFVLPDLDIIRKKELISRLYRGVLVPERLGGSLQACRAALERRATALDTRFGPGTTARLREVLEVVVAAAAPLQRLCDAHRHPATAYLDGLQQSLAHLGVSARYDEDAAGVLVVAEFAHLADVARQHELRMRWDEFRDWLGHSLEQRLFRPQTGGPGIALLGFAQSRLHRFEAVVLAGCTDDQLPGATRATPFFNDRVRRELGLSTAQDERESSFYDFRRLLESAGRVLITYRREEAGEPSLPSPWVEQLVAFHDVAYGDALRPSGLPTLVADPATLIAQRDQPMPIALDYPTVRVAPPLLPERLSATGHQRMLDCPYLYFAADCLRLREIEEPLPDLDKADYGQRVHSILHAFHAGNPNLPGPFQGPLTFQRRAEAEQLLAEIARAVFAPDIAKNFLARGWLARWLKLVPDYVAWQARREAEWRFEAAEVERRNRMSPVELELHGRIDRLDANTQGFCILDYKTGALPKPDDILSGESVQLPFYALLMQGSGAVNEVQLLGLGDRIVDKVRLNGDDLAQLTDRTKERLVALVQNMRDGQPLPAWGDESVCNYCEMQSLCRREMWSQEPT